MKTFLSALYLVSIHLILLVSLSKNELPVKLYNKIIALPSAENELSDYYFQMLKPHKRMDENVPDGSVIFIGDSLTQGLPVSAVISPSVNYGIGGDTTYGVLQRISIYESMNRASIIVIAIGLNDIQIRSNGEIINNYLNIIKKLPRSKPIVLNAILPIDENIKQRWQGINKQRINTLNQLIKSVADNESRIIFANASENLLDKNGNLSNHLHTGDGVHLNATGNKIWIRSLKEAVARAQYARMNNINI